MTAPGFAQVLTEGVELLRGFRRRRTAVAGARHAVAEWSARHPAARPQLVVDVRPGSPVVDYDLLVCHPEGGTVALSAPADDGVPWLADHSTHWAAGYLVSVDKVHVHVAEALAMLRRLPRRDRALHDEIVEQSLVLNEIMTDDEPLDEEDVRAAAEEFRRSRGLHDRASTLAWLAEMSMSGEQFEAFIAGIARRRRFRRRKEAELAPAYLADHQADFDRVRALWVTGCQPVNGELLRGLGGLLGCREAEITIGERWAGELPGPLRHAARESMVGPVEHPGGYLTGMVLARRASRDDPETLAAAGAAAFREWLAARRKRASIEWHWL
ncbi:TIGR04500 family putative peptide maturation system protein [Planotetraspora sp. A-T 1434]|uniref:TIGR04500 family putative peptide maturation system protein n=1 Tax=Planotetraspora sp. A-T 1434 TaxID=2979219 RepID=UPI0021BED4EE|nr:TIGR04500 family putative peptide maturation system protein [Planotetraspora sp. A-T 1434]MCT9934077.1 TIGR04500 family putative peptide maturation system protein [Planotetraspora sp. A-T 1434]